jgi:protein gp37
MNETEINWTQHTWNPASGCVRVSKACERCYAETLAENKRGTPAFPKGFDLTLRPHKLTEPAKLKAPSLIFVNSMSDLFLPGITDAYRQQIIDVMHANPQHRYQVLTKRPALAEKFFRKRTVPMAMWLGCTVEEQKETWRIDSLRQIDAPLRFLSCEPIYNEMTLDLTGISWVIGGGESGTHLATNAKDLEERAMVRRGDKSLGEALWVPREDRLCFARALRDQTKAIGAAFWWKQHGGPRPTSGGRMLDGRTWDEMPTHVPGAMPPNYTHKTTHGAPSDAGPKQGKFQLPLIGT